MRPKREGALLISRIHKLMGRISSKKIKDYDLKGITPAQFRILFEVWRKDGMSIQELASKTSLGKSTLTAMLDKLEEGGHVKRVPSPEDRRKILIVAKDKDPGLVKEYHKISDEMIELFYQGLSDTERDTLEDLLRKVLARLRKIEKD